MVGTRRAKGCAMNPRHVALLGSCLLPLLVAAPACSDSASPTGPSAGDPVSPASNGDGAAPGASDGAAPTAPPALDEWVMGKPFAVSPPVHAKVSHPVKPTVLWKSTKAPRPTNAWWENLVLAEGTLPVNVLPYAIRATTEGLEVSAPKRVASANAVISAIVKDMALGATEALPPRTIGNDGPVSVDVTWQGATNKLSASLVRGMAFVTADYEKLTPRLTTQHAIVNVDGKTSGTVTGDTFEIALNDGSTWLLHASAALTFTIAGQSLVATRPFDGAVRVARLDGPASKPILMAHRDAIPRGADLDVRVRGDRATVVYRWKTTGSGTALTFALPHHVPVLSPAPIAGVARETIKGPMRLVEGNTWTVALELPKVTWSAPRNVAPSRLAAVEEALRVDVADVAARPVRDDPYGFGKDMSRLGRLALVADELKRPELAKTVRGAMKTSLDRTLRGQNANTLLYDDVWGGIVSKNGIADFGADYGQGLYNDHHFHYGYPLYAAAAIAKEEPEWAALRSAELMDLARDIANPSKDDPYFTAFRVFDWYDGHSWAAGLTPFGDSRNQESTSEAVHAWYALALLGVATKNPDLTNVGRVLLAHEIRSTQTYWHITSASTVYPPEYAEKKIVGILWGFKVDHSTFFGANPAFIHGIQMLPFTPMTEELLSPAWVREAYPVLARTMAPDTSDAWKGFVYAEHAILEKDRAWDELAAIPRQNLDDGESRTNALYWVATRP